MTAGVYLYHFDPPYVSPNGLGRAGHYLGCSKNIEERDKLHRTGRGVPLIPAALAAGCTVQIVRIWPDQSFAYEQHLKHHYKDSPRLCPICNPKLAHLLYQGQP